MKTTRLISLLLLAIIVLMSFSACGEDSKSKSSNTVSYSKSDKKNNNKNNDSVEDETEEVIDPNAVDPFEGIEYTITGVSPYLEINVNTQKCDTRVQNCVEFTTDKTAYANGDTAVITAEIVYNYDEEFTLTTTTQEYEIKDQAEYITTNEGVDLSLLKTEIADMITTKIGQCIDTYYMFNDRYTLNCAHITSITTELKESYISTLKGIKQNLYTEYPYKAYNIYDEIYYCTATLDNGKEDSTYVIVSAQNVSELSDGSVEWGKNTQYELYFYIASDVSVNDAVIQNISVNSDNYNITKLTNQ